jgi:hypothetical protein
VRKLLTHLSALTDPLTVGKLWKEAIGVDFPRHSRA